MNTIDNDIHEEALRILAGAGRAESHSEDEYMMAVEQVRGSVRASFLDKALAQLGEAVEETVTREMLAQRANEILRAEGWFEWDGNEIRVPDETTQIRAHMDAIRQLGLPGEPRRDLDKLKEAARDELLQTAVDEGAITADQVQSFHKAFEGDGESAFRMVEASIRNRREAKAAFAATVDGRPLTVDDESFNAHAAAEDLLRRAGLIETNDTPHYDGDAYMVALEAVQESDGAVAAVDEAVRVRASRASLQLNPTTYLAFLPDAASEVGSAVREAAAEETARGTASATGVQYDREAHEMAIALGRKVGA